MTHKRAALVVVLLQVHEKEHPGMRRKHSLKAVGRSENGEEMFGDQGFVGQNQEVSGGKREEGGCAGRKAGTI